jgi:hypothetical protein
MPGSIIAAQVFGLVAGTWAAAAVAFAINMVASAIIARAFFTPEQPSTGEFAAAGASPNPGNRVQAPPATDNKLPVVYGAAWLGGTQIDLSITENNQELYYVLALCEVTGNGTDTITFGDIYYGGKKVTFDTTNTWEVKTLTDESTGTEQAIDGKIEIYLYRNGSYTPTNSTTSAVGVMSSAGLVYQWDGSKLMTNCAFAIVKLTYNQDLGITGLAQTRFQVTNSRHKPGECFLDYMTNTVYGGAIPLAQIDTASLDVLDAYCDQTFTYTTYSGGAATQTRFRFDGVVNTDRTIMQNLQDMSSCCDCLVKYNEVTAQWGVVVQKPDVTAVMNLNDSNMVSSISITPIDLAGSYNVIECKFPDKGNQDAFNAATFDLAEIDPALLFPNEPVNKQSISLPLVNDSVRAQYLANRMLKSGREDLQVQVNINFIGLQLEAGDIVTVTSVNYGWVAKEFRINKVIETFGDDGAITAQLTLGEFNSAVYDDVSITQFTPAPNTGIASPTFFGTVPAPTVGAQYPTDVNPFFTVSMTSSAAGIIQYAEVWYSAFATPTTDQLIFGGTTAIQSNGNPYLPNTALPTVSLVIPSGNWYLFSRMVNSLGTSAFSPASTIFRWRPRTFQYTERYLLVAYADSITGTGFDFDPRGHDYYGLANSATYTPSSNPADYTWYFADPAFGTVYFLCYINRTGRKFSFATGLAGYAAGTAAFVPTQASIFDPTLWAALPDGSNYIDLDHATGQLITTGTTTVGTGEIAISNTSDGKVVASLAQFLDFGGPYTKTATVATLTVDIYGRVVGFESPDNFYMTIQSFTATSGQTVFNVTRGTGYITGQCFVFKNGVLLDTADYTDASSTVTLSVGAVAGNTITVVSFRSYNATSGYYASFTRTTATLTAASSYTPTALVSGFELLFINGTILNEQDYDFVGTDLTNFPNLMTGLLTMIEWTPNNLGVPNGTPVNIVANTVIGQVLYAFNYSAPAFNLYSNGVLLLQGYDYSTGTGNYTLANTPSTITTVMVQQTFDRTGAA